MGKVAMARKSRQIKKKPKRTVFYVAMEGSVTERKYFDSIIRKYGLRNVYLLRKTKTRSSPRDVLKRLDQQTKKRRNDHGAILDEIYWAVFDTNGRPTKTLRQVANEAKRKNYHLAASNPCFELWLLLHFGSLPDQRRLKGLAETGGCDSVIRYCKKHYDQKCHESNFDPSMYVANLDDALENAKDSDSDENDAWLYNVGSRVYCLVESILNSSQSPNHPRH